MMETHDSESDLLDDMAAALRELRRWLMEIAEQHEDLDASAVDDLLRRYRDLRMQ